MLPSQLQGEIDSVPDGGVLELSPRECPGPIYIRRPIVIEGHGATFWALKGPVLVIECQGRVLLKNLRIEVTSEDEVSGNVDDCAIRIGPQADVDLEDVEVRGSVDGLQLETGPWRVPKTVHLGQLTPNDEHEFRLNVVAGGPCAISSGINGIAIEPSKVAGGPCELRIKTEGLRNDTMLYGKIVLKSPFVRRSFVVCAHVLSGPDALPARTGVDAQLIWQPDDWDAQCANRSATPAPAAPPRQPSQPYSPPSAPAPPTPAPAAHQAAIPDPPIIINPPAAPSPAAAPSHQPSAATQPVQPPAPPASPAPAAGGSSAAAGHSPAAPPPLPPPPQYAPPSQPPVSQQPVSQQPVSPPSGTRPGSTPLPGSWKQQDNSKLEKVFGKASDPIVPGDGSSGIPPAGSTPLPPKPKSVPISSIFTTGGSSPFAPNPAPASPDAAAPSSPSSGSGSTPTPPATQPTGSAVTPPPPVAPPPRREPPRLGGAFAPPAAKPSDGGTPTPPREETKPAVPAPPQNSSVPPAPAPSPAPASPPVSKLAIKARPSSSLFHTAPPANQEKQSASADPGPTSGAAPVLSGNASTVAESVESPTSPADSKNSAEPPRRPTANAPSSQPAAPVAEGGASLSGGAASPSDSTTLPAEGSVRLDSPVPPRNTVPIKNRPASALFGQRTENEELRRQLVPAPRPAPSKSGTDPVDCAVFAPLEAAVGGTVLVQIFAHTPRQAEDAASLALATDPDARRRAYRSLDAEVPLESKLAFHLVLPKLEVSSPVQSFVWRGIANSVSFLVSVPDDVRAPARVAGMVTISLDGIPIGHIGFTLAIVGSPSPDCKELRPVGETACRYRKAFLSYASENRSMVLLFAQLLKAAQIDYFQDQLSLEPGENWRPALTRHIDESDVFYLFWSHAARKSEWVSKEIEYALEHQVRDRTLRPAIIPVVIEGPPTPERPASLAHLHFSDYLLYLSSAFDRQKQIESPG